MELQETLQLCLANSPETESNIARQTGIHRATLSRFRRGESAMDLDNAERLLSYFQVDLRIPEDLQEPSYCGRSKYTKTEAWHEEQVRRKTQGSRQNMGKIFSDYVRITRG